MRCECIFHRYHCFHISPEGRIWPHSQAACREIVEYERRTGNRTIAVPIEEYHHNLTPEEAREIYQKYTEERYEKFGPFCIDWVEKTVHVTLYTECPRCYAQELEAEEKFSFKEILELAAKLQQRR